MCNSCSPSSALPDTRFAFGHRLTTLAACLVELGIHLHPIGPAFLDQGSERRVLRGEDGLDLDMAHALAGAFEPACWIGRFDAEEESQIHIAVLWGDVEDAVRSGTVRTEFQLSMLEGFGRPRNGVAYKPPDLGKKCPDCVRCGWKELISGLFHVRYPRSLA